MTNLRLKISTPVSGTLLTAPGDKTGVVVPLSGAALETAPVPLFYKWYSSLHVPADPVNRPKEVHLNADLTKPDCDALLTVGSHVLTFTARDQQGDTLPEMQAVQYAGMAGGPPPDPPPPSPPACVVHVLAAQPVWPTDAVGKTLTLNRADAAFLEYGNVPAATAPVRGLEAAAPIQWTEAVYQALNRIGYGWHFTPTGNPAGRVEVDLRPTLQQLQYVDAAGVYPARLRFVGRLPDTLTGSYTVSWFVEDLWPPHQTVTASGTQTVNLSN